MSISKLGNHKMLEEAALIELLVDSIHDIKGKDILILNLKELDDAPTDKFIICSGASTTQVKSIANNVQLRLKKEAGLYASHVEGEVASQWILLDYFDFVVHVFLPETRDFYDIESLWSDADRTEFSAVLSD